MSLKQCRICKCEIEVRGGRKYCKECSGMIRIQQRQSYYSVAKKRKKIHIPGQSQALSDAVSEADERGISYGRLMADRLIMNR